MTFHIGNQTGGVVNNVAGDQRITGGQHGSVVSLGDAQKAVLDLRDALASTPLDPGTAAEAREHVEEIDGQLRNPDPDRPRVAGSLEKLTRLLAKAGTLATKGAALLEPLRAIAGWLGTLGAPVLALLPAFA